MFQPITNMNSYIKNISLQKKADMKKSGIEIGDPNALSKPCKTDTFKLESFENHPMYIMKIQFNTDTIAGKIAKGKTITAEELAYLEKHDPIKAVEARLANEHRQSISAKLRAEKNKEAKAKAIKQARLDATTLNKSHSMAKLVLYALSDIESEC